MTRFEKSLPPNAALILAAMIAFFTNHANADRIFYDSFETPVVLEGATDPDGWTAGGGHPSYRRAANENGSSWSTPFGEQGMSTYSNGIGVQDLGFLPLPTSGGPDPSGEYILKFNVTSNANIGEYRAEILTEPEIFGSPGPETLVAHVAADTDGTKDMSFSDEIRWRYEYDEETYMFPTKLKIKLMQDPNRSNWRHTPVWDNVSVDFIPDNDTVGPTVLDISDDKDGGTVPPDSVVTYTVTFSEDMDPATVNPSDFGNAGGAPITDPVVVEQVSLQVFLVKVTPTDEGTLRLRIIPGSDLRDAVNNPMDTSSTAIQDNVTIAVDGTNPILLPSDIVDDKGGVTISPGTLVTYTLSFSKDMNSQSITAGDFENAATDPAPVTFGTIAETAPTSGIFTVEVTPSGGGNLSLAVKSGAILLSEDGESLDTSSGIVDDTTIVVDGIPPTLVEFTDDTGGNSVAVGATVTYDVFFSEDMDSSTVDVSDFGNALSSGSAPFTINSVEEASPGVFRIELIPTGGGNIQLQVNSGADLKDEPGNALVTTSAIVDDTIVSVDSGNPTLASSSIVDDVSGQPVDVNTLVNYTVTFSEDIDATTVTSADFGNAGSSAITIGAITETSPGEFTVEVTPTSQGSLRLQINAGADVRDTEGNSLDTTSAIADDTTITVNGIPPTLSSTSFVDDKSGNPVTVDTLVTYTLTFSKDMDASTVTAADFGNAGSSAITIGAISETSPGEFTVEVIPTSQGSLRLQINAGADVRDTDGNALDTTSAIADDTTITVESASPYETWSGGSEFNDDENGDGIPNGLAWLLGAEDADANAASFLPEPSAEGSSLRLVFSCLNSSARGGASLKVEYTSDLGQTDPWSNNEAEIPETSSTVNGVVFQITPNGDLLEVIANIPVDNESKVFARLRASSH